ncbi:MAG: protein-glutamate O-methyltransferase CheR, partial [Daejeonella sp.]
MSSDLHPYNISFDELDELISLVQNVYEFNFDGYSRASLKRRVSRIMQLKKISVYDLRSLLVNTPSFFDEFLLEITVNVTEMFRDPGFYRALREKVFP